VVQQHSARRLHYDFRLECEGVLLSWAVPKGPALDPSEKRLAVQTEDHPYDYASFEGVIPPGQYGAGEVIVWDCGVYSPDEGGTAFDDRASAESRVRHDLAAGKLSIELRGTKLKGSFALVKTREAKQWLLIKHKDRFTTTHDVTRDGQSVLSGAAVEDLVAVPARRIPAGRLVPAGPVVSVPSKLAPMLAETGDAAFTRDGWAWEPKLDGYRALAILREGKLHLRSRRGLDLAADFPALAAEIARQAVEGTAIDGEIVAFDASGRPSFGALQQRAQLKTARERAAADAAAPVAFFAFDLPFFAGVDLREAPYVDRRRYLAQCLMPSPLVHLVHAERDGAAMQQAALATGFEGVIAKREASTYHAGRRTGDWLKVKPVRTADFVIGGYSRGKGSRAALGSLLVGYWEGRKLKYASHVGSGFDAKTLKLVGERCGRMRRIRLHHGRHAAVQRARDGGLHGSMIVAERKYAVLRVRVEEATSAVVFEPHAVAADEAAVHAGPSLPSLALRVEDRRNRTVELRRAPHARGRLAAHIAPRSSAAATAGWRRNRQMRASMT